MGIQWPKEIRDILIKYHSALKTKKYVFSTEEKNRMVYELIAAYRAMSISEQACFLVPAKGENLKDKAVVVDIPIGVTPIQIENIYEHASIALQFDWPVGLTDGFVSQSDSHCSIMRKQEFDRVGPPSGRFLSPIKDDGQPETYMARAIPYYIPNEDDITSSPAYHRYVALQDYEENDEYPRVGIIAQAFRANPDDGGGKQLVFSPHMCIQDLNGKGVLEDVT